jgi:Ni,Fe-hydrogenase III large subunit/Ni,Fe-hydrogenase III component G
MMTDQRTLAELCQAYGILLQPGAPNQFYVRVTSPDELQGLARDLYERGFYLVTLVGTDERELADCCFKLTYLFSHSGDDLFVLVENPLRDASEAESTSLGSNPSSSNAPVRYTTLSTDFEALSLLEQELADMLGLYPYEEAQPQPACTGSWLHQECYPPGLYPLRRDQCTAEIRAKLAAYSSQVRDAHQCQPREGEWLLPVGPVHAGVIEPGQFLFRLGGEVVEELSIRLGYSHKGIERLFQTGSRLEDGWRLAEHISGDSIFAHSLAYCQAAEALAEVRPPREAEVLRGLFLELERMANHIGDCAAMAHDVAYDLVGSELAVLRERLLRLNEDLSGHRLLRGLNRPGGIVLSQPLNGKTAPAHQTIEDIASQFGGLARGLAQLQPFRDRMQWTGVLTRRQALSLGATGLIARASGVRRDFRLQHPVGLYTSPTVRNLAAQGLPPDDESIETREATAGDCLARFLIRVCEVESSARLVQYFLAQPELDTTRTRFVAGLAFRPQRNFQFGLGYVEGWRGDIVYWLMQDKFGRIFRCKVRDPSVLNWPALKAAVEPHDLEEDYLERHRPPIRHADSIVADFPIINKSFNLSYSGVDL